MARISDVKREHRQLAMRIPGDIRQRMPAEELRHRLKHVERIQENAPHGRAGTALRHRANRMLRAIPLREYLERKRQLNELIGDAPGGIDSPAEEYRALSARLDEDNVYPESLKTAADRRLTGASVPYPDADLDAILGLKEPVEKSWAALEEKQALLREEIRALRQRLGG